MFPIPISHKLLNDYELVNENSSGSNHQIEMSYNPNLNNSASPHLFEPAASFMAMIEEYQGLKKALGDMIQTIHPNYYSEIIEKHTD